MGRHLEATKKAALKAAEEVDKLVKEAKKAKTQQEREKLLKMAEGAQKIMQAHLKSQEAAAQKDWAETKALFNM
ncbi:MAG: hypothetical protein JNN08_15075 [Bryobacterales bacterium]|nr:hypothetical protein [Bryobacterales bacterium]